MLFDTPALGTASSLPRCRCMACSMLSSSLPAWPTKGSPARSSFSPGASPTISQSTGASGPTPKTVFLRLWQSAQAVQPATAACSAGQSMRSIARVSRSPGTCCAGGGAETLPGGMLAVTTGGFESNPASALEERAAVAIVLIASAAWAAAASRAAGSGCQTRTPISRSMARCLLSRSRLTVGASQSQTHDNGVLAF